MSNTMDSRLLDGDSFQELIANFNRMLALADALEARIAALEGQASVLEDQAGILEGRVAALDSMTVLYDANGGEGEMVDPNSPYRVGDTLVYLECTFTPPEGKVFAGWTSGEGVVQPGAELQVVAADKGYTMTLYAVWEDDT